MILSCLQDYTSQDHFCSIIDKFLVWNLKPNTAMLMRYMAGPEREKDLWVITMGPDHRWSLGEQTLVSHRNGLVIFWVVSLKVFTTDNSIITENYIRVVFLVILFCLTINLLLVKKFRIVSRDPTLAESLWQTPKSRLFAIGRARQSWPSG